VEYNLADLFECVVDAIPDHEALVCGDQRLTYAELDVRANRVAHHLIQAGVKPGEHVGLYLYNGTPYVEACLACLKIRAVPINVNYRYVEGELRYLFSNADMVALVHQREFAPRIAAVRDDVPTLRHLVSVDDGSGADVAAAVDFHEARDAGSPERDFEARSPDDQLIIYTGGTTGLPRGVMWRQEDLFFAGMGGGNPTGPPIESPEQLGENAKTRSVVTQFPIPPLIHGAALLGVFIGMFWGDRVILIPKFDPEAVWATCERERANTLTIVGDAMARPMAETLAANRGRWDLSSVVYIGSAGAVLSEAVKEQLRAELPNTMVAENFGATETGFQGMEAPKAPAEGGLPASGLRFFMNEFTTVLDDDLNRVDPGSGVVGRLARRGRIPLGYYGDPEKTARTFVEVGGERWVLPGDMATVESDGVITVFGRGAVCINTGGEKVFPEEVEQAVKAHPDVYDAVIVGVPDERWGERVAAVVQLRPGRSLTLEDLDAHCRTHIAGYKVPRELHVVDQIARQPSGKPDFGWAKAVAQGTKEPV
jgi:acyl-CoA synthetase (AMP-forming)/AMP-acid ligase II